MPYALSSKPCAEIGFTLVEVLLAVVILSIGLAGVLRAYASSVQTLEISQDNIDAMNLLKEKMAEVEQKAIEEKGLSSGFSQGKLEGDFEDYMLEMDVRPTLKESVHEVKLLVYHPDKTRQFSLITYVENKDYVSSDSGL